MTHLAIISIEKGIRQHLIYVLLANLHDMYDKVKTQHFESTVTETKKQAT